MHRKILTRLTTKVMPGFMQKIGGFGAEYGTQDILLQALLDVTKLGYLGLD